jgi:hypothetical protein
MTKIIDNRDGTHDIQVQIGVSSLNIKITGEGVIMDAFDNDLNELIGTLGMTYDEWFDFICARSNATAK